VCFYEIQACVPYGVTVYSGKDRKRVAPSLTATDTSVTGLATRTENVGYKLYKSFVALLGVSHTLWDPFQ
jgi:hypothetical protein